MVVTASYVLICPHCSKKLRARGIPAGCEMRCSLCHRTFAAPAAALVRRPQTPQEDGVRCHCGRRLVVRDRREDTRVQCSSCHRWAIVPKLATPAPASARPTPPPLRMTPVPGEPEGADGRGDDIGLARDLLAGLLPSGPPKLPGMDVAVFSQFRHEVGGDYYDFLPLVDGRLAIAIADVSGKGVAAAMLMVRLREILHSVVAHGGTPVETVATVNTRLIQNTPRGMFVTLLYAVLDPRTRELRMVNAGHCPPFVWRARLTGVRLLRLTGPALGLFPPEPFTRAISERTIALEPADCLCLFTDGISEAQNLRGEEFGEGRLAAALRHHAAQSAQGMTDGIAAAVAAHTQPARQHDDMTLILLKAT